MPLKSLNKMKKTLYLFIFLNSVVLHPIQSQTDSVKKNNSQPKSARPAHWAYKGKNGSAKWGELSPVYALCSKGKNQSPINIIKTEVKSGDTWKFDYRKTSLKIAHNEHVEDIIDNGHTIQVTLDEGSTFTIRDKVYSLKQFHFHTPSEHTIDGKSFPMEIHFVHQSDSGELAVVGVLVEEGEVNENLAKIIANFPSKKSEIKNLNDTDLALKFQLSKVSDAYHYIGSLTTPPCLENVDWLVLKNLAHASKRQINAFSSKLKTNNRPIQALNNRKVKYDQLKGKVDDN